MSAAHGLVFAGLLGLAAGIYALVTDRNVGVIMLGFGAIMIVLGMRQIKANKDSDDAG
jgi:hypothetical protein